MQLCDSPPVPSPLISDMHQALRNLEVIHTISSHTEHGTLPALASACRAFEHPALNVLWRHLQSVKPLVECLPSDLFGIDRGYVVVLQKPPDDKMWETLARYTSRVHSITQADIPTTIERLSLLMLCCPSVPASLFPNLRKLKWTAKGTRDAANFLRMFFVPSLVELCMCMISPSLAFFSVLSSLRILCPRLQRMDLGYRAETDELTRKFSPFITQAISQLHHLHTVRVWDLGNQGVEHLMQLRALRSLTLDLRTSSAWERRSHFQFPGFHDLQFFGLSVDVFEQASNFFSSLQVLRSRQIVISFDPEAARCGPTVLPQLFTILQERCDNDKLESFTLHGFPRKVHTKSGVFAPLHAFRNLTELCIETSCDMSMSDEELCQLVRAWPKLTVLKISDYVNIHDTMVPTFHGLINLLRLCPNLMSLALVIDATKLEGIDLKCPGGGSCNKNIKSLTLGNSPIEPLNVALVLSGLFPSLEQVDLRCWDLIPMISLPQKKPAMEQWALVNSILSGFSVVRERRLEA
ncbi:hypothetical protein DFH29DRAFT_604027 [Suillus ampliporus]|nr:hypothetical protein DFH29DRAFT_604027 [Suillus ampliporus]